ncbi:MAG: hypothetical protein QM286_04320 [Acidobacteriota bacterium]|nr:hypothetical protein [Acidobacteriota bacterium]
MRTLTVEPGEDRWFGSMIGAVIPLFEHSDPADRSARGRVGGERGPILSSSQPIRVPVTGDRVGRLHPQPQFLPAHGDPVRRIYEPDPTQMTSFLHLVQ